MNQITEMTLMNTKKQNDEFIKKKGFAVHELSRPNSLKHELLKDKNVTKKPPTEGG